MNQSIETTASNQHIYIDLAVVHETEYDEKYSEHENFICQMSSKRETILLDNIVYVEDNFTLITGIAGIGKSELIKKIVSKWRKRELFNGKDGSPNIEALFFLKCRELNTINFSSDGYESIMKKLFPKVFEYVTLDDLEDFSHKSMIIIDGLDELMSIEELDCPAEILNQRVQNMVQFARDVLFSSLSHFQPKYKVAVGRPHIASKIKQINGLSKLKLIHVCGFNSDSVTKYINSYCDNELQQKVTMELELSQNLSAMSHIPVYLFVICSIYKEELKITAPRTSTELMMYACLVFIRKHMIINRKNNVRSLRELCDRENVMRLIKSILWMSFKSLYEKRILFVNEDLCEIINDIDELEEKTGFVIKSANEELGNLYQFSHLVLHELFCGFHLFFSPSKKLNYKVSNYGPFKLNLIIDGQENTRTYLENPFAVVACIEGILTEKKNSVGINPLLSHFVKQLAKVYQLSLPSNKNLMNDMHEAMFQRSKQEISINSDFYMRCIYESDCVIPPKLKNLIDRMKMATYIVIGNVLKLRWNIYFYKLLRKQLQENKIMFNSFIVSPLTNLNNDDLNCLALLLSKSIWHTYNSRYRPLYEILLPQVQAQRIQLNGVKIYNGHDKDIFYRIIPYFQSLNIVPLPIETIRFINKHYVSSNFQFKHLYVGLDYDDNIIETIIDILPHLTTLKLKNSRKFIYSLLEVMKSLKKRGHLKLTSLTLRLDDNEFPILEDFNVYFNLVQYIPSVTLDMQQMNNIANWFVKLEKTISEYTSKNDRIGTLKIRLPYGEREMIPLKNIRYI